MVDEAGAVDAEAAAAAKVSLLVAAVKPDGPVAVEARGELVEVAGANLVPMSTTRRLSPALAHRSTPSSHTTPGLRVGNEVIQTDACVFPVELHRGFPKGRTKCISVSLWALGKGLAVSN